MSPRLPTVRDWLQGRRALVVTPTPQAVSQLPELLASFGMQPTLLASGEEAVAALEAAAAVGAPVDLVLLDAVLPEGPGLQWVPRLRGSGGASCDFLLLVDGPADAYAAEARVAGVGRALPKPVSASALSDALLGLYERGHGPPPSTKPPPTKGALERLRGLRILLVEDNELNQEVATEMLGELGAVITIAPNGQEGVARAKAQPFDLVLMDLQMPVMDGLTATRHLRAEPSLRELPIVAMTANALPAEREACLAAGMNDHVAKPIDPDELFRACLRWASVPRAGPLAVARPTTPAAPLELPRVDGLDTQAALRRVGGRRDLYLSLLRRYATEHAADPARIRAAVEAGDLATAERLAHTLKSVSATLGCERVRAAAALVEVGLHTHEPLPRVLELVHSCGAVLDPVVDALGAQLPPDSGGPRAPAAGA